MKHFVFEDMIKGWFVGKFSPTAYSTSNCEVAVKYYTAGDRESEHYLKIATEITMVISGRVRMAGNELTNGDIIVLSPGEVTDFEALTDAINVVVKTPGVLNDKYLVKPDI